MLSRLKYDDLAPFKQSLSVKTIPIRNVKAFVLDQGQRRFADIYNTYLLRALKIGRAAYLVTIKIINAANVNFFMREILKSLITRYLFHESFTNAFRSSAMSIRFTSRGGLDRGLHVWRQNCVIVTQSRRSSHEDRRRPAEGAFSASH